MTQSPMYPPYPFSLLGHPPRWWLLLRALAALPIPGQAHLQAVVQALMPAQAAQQAALPLVVLPTALAPGRASASGSTSASGDSAKITATKAGERDDAGYHLNTPKQGAPP